MNQSYCPFYDTQNCSTFSECYVCNISIATIEKKYNILPYCSQTDFCISNQTLCNDNIYLDQCITSNNIIKTGIGILVFLLYAVSYKRITNVLQINRYSELTKLYIISFHSIVNFIIPIILIFLTYLIYLEYFVVCILSFILTMCCIPSSRSSQYVFNLNYNPYTSLSHTMPITPVESPTERIIQTIPEEQNENPPAYEDLENNNSQPITVYQT